MEGSAVCPEKDDAKMGDSPEESSWTFYIEGFMRDEDDDNNNNNSSFSSEFESPSLVSDAASSAVKKLTNYYNCCTVCTDHEGGGVGFSPGKSNINPRTMFNKQNSFKKQKTKVLLPMDYDLEDTASSPVNSPKVSYMNQFMNDQKEKDKMDVSEVRRNSTFGKGGIFAVERENNYPDLKKRNCG